MPVQNTNLQVQSSLVAVGTHDDVMRSASRRTVRICDVCSHNSRQGYNVSLCAGCLGVSYCVSSLYLDGCTPILTTPQSRECQRSDWKKHKPICAQQKAMIESTTQSGELPAINLLMQWHTVHLPTLYFAAIHGELPVTLICFTPNVVFLCLGLNLTAHPEYISKKALFVQLLEPEDPTSVLDIKLAFRMSKINVLYRETLSLILVKLSQGDPSLAMKSINDDDIRAKSEGYLGSALVVLCLGGGSVLPLPLRIRKENVPRSRSEDWEGQVRGMIDRGEPFYREDKYVEKLQRQEDLKQAKRRRKNQMAKN